MILSNKRPDVVFHSDPLNGRAIVVDCRTNDPTCSNICSSCALTPGTANDAGANSKTKAWLPATTAQQDQFLPFCIEVGGRISPTSLDFLQRLSSATSNSTSDAAAFLTWALQRIHCTSQRGVAQMILACPITRSGAYELPFGGLIPLGLPPPPLALRRTLSPRLPPTPPTWPLQAALAMPTPPQLTPRLPTLPPTFHFPVIPSNLPSPPRDQHHTLAPPTLWPPQSPPTTPLQAAVPMTLIPPRAPLPTPDAQDPHHNNHDNRVNLGNHQPPVCAPPVIQDLHQDNQENQDNIHIHSTSFLSPGSPAVARPLSLLYMRPD
mmetsp:Transcript_33463/g.61184  ORF Transcript_33463/g.61184 Transcript_33463/m.61184 type:complete len:321 (-) Transcript_33463:110-1072(-)